MKQLRLVGNAATTKMAASRVKNSRDRRPRFGKFVLFSSSVYFLSLLLVFVKSLYYVYVDLKEIVIQQLAGVDKFRLNYA
jgi:hypothetical protein